MPLRAPAPCSLLCCLEQSRTVEHSQSPVEQCPESRVEQSPFEQSPQSNMRYISVRFGCTLHTAHCTRQTASIDSSFLFPFLRQLRFLKNSRVATAGTVIDDTENLIQFTKCSQESPVAKPPGQQGRCHHSSRESTPSENFARIFTPNQKSVRNLKTPHPHGRIRLQIYLRTDDFCYTNHRNR